MQFILLFYSLCFLFAWHGVAAELIDAVQFEDFCYPEQLKNSQRACKCSLFTRADERAPWEQQGLRIDCSYAGLKPTDFSSNLPTNAYLLDVTWNKLTVIPKLYSDDLHTFNLMHNNITSIAKGNFADMPNLRRIYLNWNSIQTIEMGAFKDLTKLEVLDVSHNNLHNLAPLLFASLVSLTTLDLSWNRQLALNTDVQELNFYTNFGLQEKLLRFLNLEQCGFANLVLPLNAQLVELNLRGNELTKVPRQLPLNLSNLDISANLLGELLPIDVSGRTQLETLYLDDMPNLEYIAANALANLPSLQKLSVQNCRRLHQLDGEAFGNDFTNPSNLKSLNLRGSRLATLNGTASMLWALQNLEELDIYGMPLECDCHLTWLKSFAVESNGLCIQPSRLRGRRIADIPVSEFDCRAWPEWLYGVIIFCMLAFCSACIYFIFIMLRPYNGVQIRNKVGAGSPYAPITIQPNNQDYNHL